MKWPGGKDTPAAPAEAATPEIPKGWTIDITFRAGWWGNDERIPPNPQVRIESRNQGAFTAITMDPDAWPAIRAAVDRAVEYVQMLPRP